MVLLFSSQEHFRVLDLLYPLGYDKEPVINSLGALALYLVLFVAVTSYLREAIGRRRWKLLHFTSYAAASVFFVHSILTDPTLKDKPVDYFDGERCTSRSWRCWWSPRRISGSATVGSAT